MYGMLIDVTRCTGCEKCIVACGARQGVDRRDAERERATTPDGLSARRLATIAKVDEGRFARKSCMHCLEPGCVSVCLVGGLTKTPEGPVIYDPDKCIGCRYCMLSCPFHIPRYEWDKTIPYVAKCDLCFDRLQQGQLPACVEACPHDVLTFGQREQMLIEAHERIGRYPERYHQHVWGENEFGGTSVLYVADVDLASLGWPAESPPIPSLTEPLVHTTPFIGFGVAVGLIGLNWIVRRRSQLAKEDREQHSGESENV